MTFDPPHLLFIACEIIVFLVAISVHESAHALVADRCGDPTARMLGRISLNPIRHIDLFGTIIFPAIGLLTGFGILGWAKPTPVIARNFRNYRSGDILTTVAGPVSNIMLALLSTLLLIILAWIAPGGRALVSALLFGGELLSSPSALMPLALLLYLSIEINVLLAVFNLIPVPPLDGSHIIRHFLPEPALRLYDRMGMIGLLLVFVFAGRFLSYATAPILNIFRAALILLTH